MIIKRYECNDIQQAVSRIKLDLGPESQILYIREIKRYRSFRLAAIKKIEVIAGRQDTSVMDSAVLQMFKHDLKEMRSVLGQLVQQQNERFPLAAKFLPLGLKELFERLVACGVEEDLAESMMKELKERFTEKELSDSVFLEEQLIKKFSGMFEVSGPLHAANSKIVAFVGPTGVGKTTTIAKLAANVTLLEKKKVALVTLDTYRIAAVEQLKTYAEIMEIPLEVVFNFKDLLSVLDKYRQYDLVLIDTAGRSPLNVSQMQELKNFLGQDNNIEVQLLISLTTKSNEITQIFKRFEIIHVHRIILTKLDEVETFGNLLSVAVKIKRPISYITTGQNVPEDIEVADSFKLARLVLNKDSNPFAKKVPAVS